MNIDIHTLNSYTPKQWEKLFLVKPLSFVNSQSHLSDKKNFDLDQTVYVSYMDCNKAFIEYSQHSLNQLSIKTQKLFWHKFKQQTQNLIFLADTQSMDIQKFILNFHSGWRYGGIDWVSSHSKKYNLGLTLNKIYAHKNQKNDFKKIFDYAFFINHINWHQYLYEKVLPSLIEQKIPTNNLVKQMVHAILNNKEKELLSEPLFNNREQLIHKL